MHDDVAGSLIIHGLVAVDQHNSYSDLTTPARARFITYACCVYSSRIHGNYGAGHGAAGGARRSVRRALARAGRRGAIAREFDTLLQVNIDKHDKAALYDLYNAGAISATKMSGLTRPPPPDGLPTRRESAAETRPEETALRAETWRTTVATL